MDATTLSPETLHQIDAYWRAANYFPVGQIYLSDNPLLKRQTAASFLQNDPKVLRQRAP